MKRKTDMFDMLLIGVISLWALLIVLPFLNVVAVSFTSSREYLAKPLLLFPSKPTLKNYVDILEDARIGIGYRTTLRLLIFALPLNLFLTVTFAYGLSRKGYPGRGLIFFFVLFTMLFNGGILPMYMLMMNLGLTNTLGALVFASGVNTFYVIITRNFFSTLPDSLIESAKIDGAGEWRILWRIILPLSLPILATMTLFYTVDRWNEWWFAKIFIKSASLQPLQLVLRSMVLESNLMEKISPDTGAVIIDRERFSEGMKMSAVIITMFPVMCIFPFLQRYFVKGVLIGAIKS